MSVPRPGAWYPKVVRSPRGTMQQNKATRGGSAEVRKLLAQVRPKAPQ